MAALGERQAWEPLWAAERAKYLAWFFRLVGGVTLLAFAAALMPSSWFVEITAELRLESFPEHPLAFYLARHLSALYGCVGVLLLIIASDIQRFGPVVRPLGWGTMAFGVLQCVIGAWSAMPWYWTLYEGPSTVLGGGIILALARWCRRQL
ncbi:hypothetical protein SH139x_004759 [Planctomycetaceae bacterium SH139]